MSTDPRIGLNSLASLCRRVGISLEAGIDVRSVWAREAERRWGLAASHQFRAVSNAIQAGQSLGDALGATGNFFPQLFREMVIVGEETGRLAEVFSDLAGHYESRLKLRRMFLSALAWPLTELGISLTLVAVVIWLTGIIRRTSGTHIDILGFGLIGTQGLIIYFTLLLMIGGVLAFGVRCVRRGLFWNRGIERIVDRIPCVGGALRTLALSRLAWALAVTMGAGMEVRRALKLSLQSSQSFHFSDASATIDTSLSAGESVYDALAVSRAFPQEFLDTLDVGEQSGKLPETLDRLSRQYRVQAQSAIAALTKVAGYVIWALVALLIITIIFRVANFYLGMINLAAGG